MGKLLTKLLATSTETEVLEFKEAKNQFDINKLGKYFSALSNEANLGNKKYSYILFGIKDDKTIVGTHITDTQINDYKKEIADNTALKIGFESVTREHSDGHDVLIFKIPAAPTGMPISWKGLFYGREGESLVGLNLEKIERIRNQKIANDWSAEEINNAGIDDLSPEAIKKAKKEYLVKHSHLKEMLLGWDDLTFLNKAKICIKGKITRTAILLLGKPESAHFIEPGSATITWILKDKDNVEKDYVHFSCPLILSVNQVFSKIRNLKYRYLQDNTIFPEEVDQYDPYIIREAIHNCIAHQDYTLGGRINIVEREDGYLTFTNSGSFIPGSIENILESDAPENRYRNDFLSNAMVNLNMIDTIGSGIKKMYISQRKKFFPLPDYNLKNDKVSVKITGKILDLNYAKKLAQSDQLSLRDIFLLDKIAKHQQIQNNEVKELKKRGLIEGRKPNYFISSEIAKKTNEKVDYIKNRGLNTQFYKTKILQFIDQYQEATREEINNLIIEMLPGLLNQNQKENKIKNILQEMSVKDHSIECIGRGRYAKWVKYSSKK